MQHLPSESLFHVAGRTRAVWTGLSGLFFLHQENFTGCFDMSSFWLAKDSSQDYLDFRPFMRGTIIDQEIFTRKARNFADSINANMVLPFANQQVAEYFAKMPEQHLFDRKALKNKLILRKISQRPHWTRLRCIG